MIYNDVIFDFGNVLEVFSPRKLTEHYAENEEDRKLLEKVMFDRKIWGKLDLGTITDDECKQLFHQQLPERLHAAAEKTYDEWIYNMYETPGIRELVLKIKAEGCRLFVLSNISRYFSSHADEKPILSLFDGAVFSADIGIVKPDPKIFAYICDKYGIKPENAVFIDDKSENIAAAKEFGLDTYEFHFDVAELESFLFREVR